MLRLSTLILATPSRAARCGGDFNSFEAAMSAQATRISPAVSAPVGAAQIGFSQAASQGTS
jgi:hypothetical protein